MVIKLNVRSLHSGIHELQVDVCEKNYNSSPARLSFKATNVTLKSTAMVVVLSATGTADQDIAMRKIFNAPGAPLILCPHGFYYACAFIAKLTFVNLFIIK